MDDIAGTLSRPTDRPVRRDRARRLPAALAVIAAFSAPTFVGATSGVAADSPLQSIGSAAMYDYCALRGSAEIMSLRSQSVNTDSGEAGINSSIVMLVNEGLSIVEDSPSTRQCRREFRKGNKTFDKLLRKNLKLVQKAVHFTAAEDDETRSIQLEISRLWIEDQAARRTYTALRLVKVPGAAEWAYSRANAHAMAIDTEALAYMRGLLNQFDWIDQHRFGPRISANAWLLVQHADRDPELQALVLQRMQPYLESGGVSKRNYAYLWDRVAVNHGRLQRFGTQPTWECRDGKLELQPMEYPDSVNERRRQMGLGTVEDGLAEMSAEVCVR